MRYIVELTDDDGRNCQVRLSIPWDTAGTDTTNSTWRVLNEGFIRYRSGGCFASGGRFESLSLRLIRAGEYGVTLNNFTSEILRTINSSGAGTIEQPWCLTFKPGRISWTLIE